MSFDTLEVDMSENGGAPIKRLSLRRITTADSAYGGSFDFSSPSERLPKFPDLAKETCRHETFVKFWPKQMLQNLIPDFVKCGFFYTSEGDRVQCYECGVRVCKWLPGHDPRKEHARHQPLCPLVQDVQQVEKVKCATQTVEEMLINNLAEEKFLMVQQACYSAAMSSSCVKFKSLIGTY